jgi:hypothetical protein
MKKELVELVNKIQSDPEKTRDFLLLYKDTDIEVQRFVNSLRAPSYLVPSLIETFGKFHTPRETTYGDLVQPNTLFSLTDGSTYQYAGEFAGIKYCTPINSPNMETFYDDMPIKWLF